MYRLHYAPDNASLCIRLALLELGVPFETVLIDRRAKAEKSPAYLAINPNGQIPTLETSDGPVFETAAILLLLGDRHRDGAILTPDFTARDRGKFLTWLFWLSNTLHPQLRMIFYPDRYLDAAHSDALNKRTRERIDHNLTILENALPDLAAWLGARQPSVLDCYLCPMLRWLALYPRGQTEWFSLATWPGLLALAQRMEQRSSVHKAVTAEGLGPFAFSRPVLPRPPEGSAT